MKTNIKFKTSFVSPVTIKHFTAKGYLPIFVIRNISNSDIIGKYANTPVHVKALSPTTSLFRKKRDGLITVEEFGKEYVMEVLSNTNLEEEVKKLVILAELAGATGIVLMGYGSDDKKCHRSVLADLINSSGLVEEKVREVIF